MNFFKTSGWALGFLLMFGEAVSFGQPEMDTLALSKAAELHEFIAQGPLFMSNPDAFEELPGPEWVFHSIRYRLSEDDQKLMSLPVTSNLFMQTESAWDVGLVKVPYQETGPDVYGKTLSAWLKDSVEGYSPKSAHLFEAISGDSGLSGYVHVLAPSHLTLKPNPRLLIESIASRRIHHVGVRLTYAHRAQSGESDLKSKQVMWATAERIILKPATDSNAIRVKLPGDVAKAAVKELQKIYASESVGRYGRSIPRPQALEFGLTFVLMDQNLSTVTEVAGDDQTITGLLQEAFPKDYLNWLERTIRGCATLLSGWEPTAERPWRDSERKANGYGSGGPS